ncbi:MAG: hypothetical protein OXT09_03655 [Myxococcales bacterium]|nr:hypothetical protein [Myxococcales bacterium]
MAACYQLVFCVGPRCCTRGCPGDLIDQAARVRDADPALRGRVHLGTFDCLARCPAGPNVIVRALGKDALDPGEPGMRDLDGRHYWSVDEPMLERILREDCRDGRPIEGRHQRY